MRQLEAKNKCPFMINNCRFPGLDARTRIGSRYTFILPIDPILPCYIHCWPAYLTLNGKELTGEVREKAIEQRTCGYGQAK